jgi:quercetin dioxygenase-like cupin family protein
MADKEENQSLNPWTTYDRWMESQAIPIHTGYYVEDLRTLELGSWKARGCKGAFLQLEGQVGFTEAYVTEIAPGESLPAHRMLLNEVVYVVEGRGLTTVWGGEGMPRKTFEWQKHSMFLIPGNYSYQLSNTQGSQPARLLHCNHLPTVMAIIPDPDFFFKNPVVDSTLLDGEDRGRFYSEARIVMQADMGPREERKVWVGNFFPDMKAWDRLDPFKGRGAGGHVVWIKFPKSAIGGHMSVFPSRTYKKAHRHGPGPVIVIPAGEGYSIMWPEGKEKIIIPWHAGSVFIPPTGWFHQHFNVGAEPARYLALQIALRGPNVHQEKIQNRERDQIEYPNEEPWIRQRFEGELAKGGLTTLMPEEAYEDRNFEWSY